MLHDSGIANACPAANHGEPLRVAQREGRAKRVADVAAEQAIEQPCKRTVPGRVIHRVEDGHGQRRARAEHPHHFAQRLRLVIEEHQGELADNRVEAVVG
jgi:hypothetical protein